MSLFTVRQVSVWLDSMAPAQGAFAHALEWASHLRLPLRAVPLVRDEGTTERLESCKGVCSRQGVAWEVAAGGDEDRIQPTLLHVLSSGLPKRQQDLLCRRVLQCPDAALLLSPTSWRPISRILVLHEERDPECGYLDSVIRLCRLFQVLPVVLTVAHSERVAQLRQQFAEELFAGQRMPADFDTAVTADLRTAAAWAARWRHCSHVFVKRRRTQSWWLRREHETIESLIDLADSLAILALPGSWRSCPGQQTPLKPATASSQE